MQFVLKRFIPVKSFNIIINDISLIKNNAQ